MNHGYALPPAVETLVNANSTQSHTPARTETPKNVANNLCATPWYLRGLRPIENEIEVFLKNDYVWLGY